MMASSPTGFAQRVLPAMTGGVSILSRKPRPKVERHYAQTQDGWKIALHRYPNDEAVRAGRRPVLLCHGLGANRFNLDAPGRLSLARWIWAQGYESWVIELRGSGYSSRPRITNELKYDWTFDDYVEFLPNVVSAGIGPGQKEIYIHSRLNLQ